MSRNGLSREVQAACGESQSRLCSRCYRCRRTSRKWIDKSDSRMSNFRDKSDVFGSDMYMQPSADSPYEVAGRKKWSGDDTPRLLDYVHVQLVRGYLSHVPLICPATD